MERRRICPDSSILVDALGAIDVALTSELGGWLRDGVQLVAPDLIHYEFTHALTKHVRNKVFTPTSAASILEAILNLKIDLVDDDALHQQALTWSMATPGLSGYDAQFLVVAQRFDAELWTRDKQLARISGWMGFATRFWDTRAL